MQGLGRFHLHDGPIGLDPSSFLEFGQPEGIAADDSAFLLGGPVRAGVLVEDDEDPAPVADLLDDGRVMGIRPPPALDGLPAVADDPPTSPKPGVTELEHVPRADLGAVLDEYAPDIVGVRSEGREPPRPGDAERLDDEGRAFAVADPIADAISGEGEDCLVRISERVVGSGREWEG
jgi:hypothetical protein